MTSGPLDMNTITDSFFSSTFDGAGAGVVEIVGAASAVTVTFFSETTGVFSVEEGDSFDIVAPLFPPSVSSTDSDDDEDIDVCPSPPDTCTFSLSSSDKLPTMSADSAISATGRTRRGSSDPADAPSEFSPFVWFSGRVISIGLSGFSLISCG